VSRLPPEEPPQLQKREQPGGIRAVVLAVLVHAAFFGLIVFGVNWQSRPTDPVSVELVRDLPRAEKAAPAEPAKAEPAKPPEPKPEPPKPEPPKPEPPKPEPPKPEPPKPEPVKPEPPRPDPAIALKAEREKKEREKKERLESEKREKETREREKAEEAKKKRDQEEVARKKREQEEIAKKKREDDKRRAEDEAKRAAQVAAQQAAAAAQQSEIDKYRNAIINKVRGRANVPDSVTGRPTAVFLVRLLPGGEVLDVQLVKASGNPAYDAAIERAIRSASPFNVPPANSELFARFRELNLQIQHER
jgi:colicin import membrane protein